MHTIVIQRTDENATLLLKDALASLSPDEECTILFENGEYRFYAEGAHKGAFFPSNNASGIKTVIFPLLGYRHLTIDGGGSDFIFCDRVFPFILQNCENITLKNFTVDFSFPRHAEAKVLASDKKGFLLSIDAERFPHYTENGHLVFPIGSCTATTAEKKFFLNDRSGGAPPAYLFAGDSLDSTENLPAKALLTDAEHTDGGIYFRYRKGSAKILYPIGDTLFIGNDENRENDVIFAEFSRDVRLANIRIYRGAGMGLIAQMCTDITVEHLDIRPKPGRDTLLSITADGLHFVHCDGTITVRHSHIEKTIDDALNLHGVYVPVDRILSPYKISLRFGHHEQSGLIPWIAGDSLRIHDMQNGVEKGEITVADVQWSENRDELILYFDKDIRTRISAKDALENRGRMPEFLFENNTVIGCPHLRISTPKKTVLRSNHIEDTQIRIDDLYDFWYESGSVGNFTICDNTFVSSGMQPCIVSASHRRGSAGGHEHITVCRNLFRTPAENAMRLEAAEKLTVEDNQFRL